MVKSFILLKTLTTSENKAKQRETRGMSFEPNLKKVRRWKYCVGDFPDFFPVPEFFFRCPKLGRAGPKSKLRGRNDNYTVYALSLTKKKKQQKTILAAIVSRH